MDDCVDCGRRLQDLVCRSCHQIYVQVVQDGMHCQNCGMQMIHRRGSNTARYQCGYCLYKYFALAMYDPSVKEKLWEYMNALERPCVECGCIMTLNPMTHELVCKKCGLVYEQPIYTRL